MRILTVEQMVEVDRLSSEVCGIPGLILMENAGIQLLRALETRLEEDFEWFSTAIFCGKGNNGGDGLVLARQLAMRGFLPDVFLLGKAADVKGDAAVNLEICQKSDGEIVEIDESNWPLVEESLEGYDVIVDALLGSGLDKPLGGLYAKAVAAINRTDAYVVAVDIPTGMFSDAVVQDGECIFADLTVTFTAPKVAHILHQRQEAIGELEIVPIGSPDKLLERPDFNLDLMEAGQVAAFRVPRLAKSHKGSYGHVAVVAGSRGKSGAAVLTGSGALRSGSGLVTCCVPNGIQPQVASQRPELMTAGFSETSAGGFDLEALPRLLDNLQGRDVAAIGPGLGQEEVTGQLIRRLVQQLAVPIVLDADGINAFAKRADQLNNQAGQPLVVTPHPGEFSRLTGLATPQITSAPVASAREFAVEHELWLVLKGFRTLVATPEGQVYACPHGNPGMATAGMGDVLTGVLAATLGMAHASGRCEPSDVTRAVILGVFLHALAGDLAAQESGLEALTAGAVLDSIAEASKTLEST